MYKPSDAIIEQIAREYYNAFFERKMVLKDYDSLPDEKKAEIKEYQVLPLVVDLPTIHKALEIYENQPQWQDNPDKEGWYCAMAKGRQCGWYWLYTPVNPVYVYKQKGALYLRKYDVEDFILKDYTLSEFLKQYSDYGGIKFLYLPEPEPYKERE